MNQTTGEQLLTRIRERAHWRFLIEPNGDDLAFGTRGDARDALQQASVRLRGWDFPHFDQNGSHGAGGGNRPVESGWESWTEFYDLETCRIYQSGQFIQYATLHEDSDREGWGPRGARGPFLDFVSTIWHITEFVEFARRLTALGSYGNGVNLSVQLSKVSGRHLTAEIQRGLFSNYACDEDQIRWRGDATVEQLSVSSPDIAREAVRNLFEWFRFETDDSVIAEVQSQLLERRFR